MNEWILILAMMLVTFVPRMLPLLLAQRLKLPAWLSLSLNYVPIAVLTIIITQTVFYDRGQFNTQLSNPYLWAAVAAVITALIQKRLFVTLFIGLLVYTLSKYALFNLAG